MNLHPDILAQAALLPRPVSFQDLRYIVGLKRGWQCWQRQRPERKATGTQGPDRLSFFFE